MAAKRRLFCCHIESYLTTVKKKPSIFFIRPILEETVISFEEVNTNKLATAVEAEKQLIQTAGANENPTPMEENFATLIDKNTSSSSLFSSFSPSNDGGQLLSDNAVLAADMTMKSINDGEFGTLNSMATMVINKDNDDDDDDSTNQILRSTSPRDQTMAKCNDDVDNSGTMIVMDKKILKKMEETNNEYDVNRVRACIQREVRQLDKLNDMLNGVSKEEVKLRLMYLDEQMEREIERLKMQYENKRNTILEIIEMKKKNAQIF